MGHSVQRPSKTQSHAGLAPQQLEASSQTSPEKAGAGATTGRALARHDECRVHARILVACYDLVVANKHYTQQTHTIRSHTARFTDPHAYCPSLSLQFHCPPNAIRPTFSIPIFFGWFPIVLCCLCTSTQDDPRCNHTQSQRLAVAQSIHNLKRQHLADARNNYKLQCMMAPSVRTLGLVHSWRFFGFICAPLWLL